MPQPEFRTIHTSRPLTNITVATIQSAQNFIAGRVCPVIPVDFPNDKYYVFGKNQFLRDEMRRRGDNEESAGSGFTLSDESYNCEVWALHQDLGHLTRLKADAVLRLEQSAARWLGQQYLIRRERQWVSDFFASSVWTATGSDGTPSPTWDDVLSDPIADIEAAKEAVLGVSGMEVNTAVLGYQVFRQLRRHPDIADLLKYTGDARNITAQMLGQIFDIQNFFVTKAVYATNLEGVTAAYSFAAGKHAWFGHVAQSPALETPSAMYCFSWTGVGGSVAGDTIATSRIEIPALKTIRIEVESAWDNKVVDPTLGYFISGAVA